MQHTKGLEFLDLGRTLSRSRSTSMSSDSQLPRIHLLAPPPVNPPPSFIASSAASQIITADQEFNAADFVADDEDDGSSASALVAPQALGALNGFLDHLLFNILATSKSTQLASIRPAVADVLKPRLAREVVSAADEELSEYMGGPEDEEFEFHGGQPPRGEFDLIRSWKLTRLRCMVYTRLGDMEEDDEEEFIAEDGLTEDDGGAQRFTSHVGNITPAGAIFLTSIIEHIGEQALVIAGETARSRLSAKASSSVDESQAPGAERATMDRLVVEDLDMEKLALNPTLGRLWRTWRKRLRTPNLSRAISRESIIRRGTTGGFSLSRKSSINTIDELLLSIPSTAPATEASPSDVDPVAIPLPMSDHDIEEIENVDFHHDMDGAEIVQTMEAVVAHKVRPRSLMVLTLPSPRSPTSGMGCPSPGTPNSSQSSTATRHARSMSLPNASVPEAEDTNQATDKASPTPSEERKRLETMYEHEEDSEPVVVAQPTVVSVVKTEAVAEEPTTPAEVSEQAIETAAASPLSAVFVEALTSQTSSIHESSTLLSDRIQTDTDGEVIEGQGMAEKPKLATIQRPKRKSSRITSNNEPPTEAVVAEDQLPREDTLEPMPPVVAADVAQKPATELTTAEPTAPRSQLSSDSTVPETRPVSKSGESGTSDRPRARPKPSPLSLSTGNPPHPGRTSPGLPSASSAIERATVQRLPGKASGSVTSSNYAKSRRSDSISSNRERRPVTAGSTTSQVSSKLKGLISRPAEPAPATRLRSSSETSRTSAVTGDSIYDDKSGLDELIRSEETIHYTLTPKTMREMENPDSPRWRAHRTNTSDLAEFLKNTAPPGDFLARPRTSNTSTRDVANIRKSSDQPKYKPIQVASMGIQTKSTGGQARDAKSSTGSTKDLAGFIKSSGPDTPPTANNTQNGTPKQSRFRRFSDAAELSKKFTRPTSSIASTPRQNGPRPQARPAAMPREDSAGLIDFIREGPPTAGSHRIPRTVAPFRDTMDSEDLESIEPAGNNTNVSVAPRSMVHAGSRTGPVESSKKTTAYADRAATMASNEPHPVRKQSRIPDPYAIDYDDDYDDDELEELLEAPKPKREEESLMDFLRNVPPPPSEAPPQPLSVNAAHVKNSSSNTFGGASAIKARLLRSTSADKTPVAKSSRTSLRQPPENYRTTTSNYTTKVGMERSAGTLRTSPSMPSVSERQTETGALADFLRSTGPPEPVPTRSTPGPGSRVLDSNNLSRLFARRKKVGA
ncbi:hypothetical protein FE257_002941 [Aspergillus nanangensis]|uniref:Uncharacterized protein n=1 Tax=Aspergillus nanangensis TaxID=2582783 RepID=A0AAD4CUJ6_ASPNN|nr:hypothetical protein FE257_002941 [Aspergillus nanangensis]